MDELLTRLIEAYNGTEGDRDARIAAARAALVEELGAEGADIDLGALVDAAIDRFNELSADADGGELSDDDLAVMEAVAGITLAAREEIAAADEVAAQRRARAEELAALVNGGADDTDGEGDDTGGADTDGGDGGGEGGGDGGGETAPAETEREPVGATASSAARTSAAAAARRTPRRTPVPLGRRSARVAGDNGGSGRWRIRAAADIPGVASGAELNGLDGIVQVAQEKLHALARTGSRNASQLVTLQRELPPEHVAADRDGWRAVEAATNERNLRGGSLVAAGGWCAPSETLYDMGVDAASVDGMVDLPTVGMPRGGLRFPVPPMFSDVYGYGGYFHYTEAQVAAGTNKPCFEITCPDMDEVRLDVEGLCVTAPILTDRAWPENTRYIIAQALAAHAHRMNAFTLASMVAKAGAATALPAPGAGITPLSAMATTLGFLELVVTNMLYRNRLPENTTIELVAPRWFRGVLRSDLTKKTFADPATQQVTNAQLDAYLRSRGVNPQWVVDWQDSFATGVVTDFGGAEFVPTAWPGTVNLLLYVAGTYFRGGDNLVRLDGLYDSTNMRTNTFTALFTEESIGVGMRGHKPELLTLPVCPTGAGAPSADITCPTV